MAQGNAWRFDVRSSLLTLAVVAVWGFGYLEYRKLTVPPPPKEAAGEVVADLDRIQGLKLGYVGSVRNPASGSTIVVKTQDDYQSLADAEEAGDDLTVQELLASGRAFAVSAGAGARLVGKGPFGTVKLHMTGGDNADLEGWTSGEFFR